MDPRLAYDIHLLLPHRLHARTRTSLLIIRISQTGGATLINLLLLLKSRPTPIADVLTMRVAYIGYTNRLSNMSLPRCLPYPLSSQHSQPARPLRTVYERRKSLLYDFPQQYSRPLRSLIYDNYLVRKIATRGRESNFRSNALFFIILFFLSPTSILYDLSVSPLSFLQKSRDTFACCLKLTQHTLEESGISLMQDSSNSESKIPGILVHGYKSCSMVKE